MKKLRINGWLVMVFVLVTLLPSGCNTLVFNRQMPELAENVDELPDFMEGDFLTLDYDSNRLNCQLYFIVRESKTKISSTTQSVKYLDSTKLAQLGNVHIDSAYLFNKQLHVQTNAKEIILNLSDSIASEKPQRSFDLDLSEGFFMLDFNDSIKQKALLKIHKNEYFLNFEYEDGPNWYVWKIEDFPTHISIVTQWVDKSILENDSSILREFKIKEMKDSNGDGYLLAEVDDDAFNRLMQKTNFLHEERLLKILPQALKSTKWRIPYTMLSIMTLLAIALTLFMKRLAKGRNSER